MSPTFIGNDKDIEIIDIILFCLFTFPLLVSFMGDNNQNGNKMEKEMYYDEDRNLILITNENYKKYLGLDVECVLCISSGAQGAFGTAEFWTSDGKGYGCSYLYHIEWDNLIKVVPILENTVEGYLLDGNKVAEGWVRKEVIGSGYFLFIKEGLESKYGED